MRDGAMTADERQQGGVANGGETCCRTLAVTPMRHKGLTGWRYDCKCNYMITLVTEPRTAIFGVLREWGVERSAEGKAVYEVWQQIEAKFPGVRATYNAIMPDHFHGIVYITFDGAAELGEVVAFFAAEVERRIGRRVWCGLWRESVCLAKGQLHRQIEYVVSNAKRRWIKENNPGLFRKVMGFNHWRLDRANETLGEVAGADSWDFRRFAHDPAAEYWDLETGEEIAKPRKANRLQRTFGEQQAYDSKVGAEGRQQAYDSKGDGLACCRTLAVVPTWTALGNPFLLDAPLLVSVRVSTMTPPDELDRLVAKVAAKAERGAVVIGPWISPGEKLIKAAVAEADGRIVQLLPEGMGRYYKPGGRDFELCAEGRMLQLSPFAPREAGAERVAYGKARFEWLNLAARAMGDLAMGFSRAQLGKTASVRQQGVGARQQACCSTLAVTQGGDQ